MPQTGMGPSVGSRRSFALTSHPGVRMSSTRISRLSTGPNSVAYASDGRSARPAKRNAVARKMRDLLPGRAIPPRAVAVNGLRHSRFAMLIGYTCGECEHDTRRDPVLRRLRVAQRLPRLDPASEARPALRVHRRSRADPVRGASRRPRTARAGRAAREGALDEQEPGAEGASARRSAEP